MEAIFAHIISSAADVMKRTNATFSSLYDRLTQHYAAQYGRCAEGKVCLIFSVALTLFNEAQAGNMSLLHFDECVCVHASGEGCWGQDLSVRPCAFYVDGESFYIQDEEAWMKNAIWDSFLLMVEYVDGVHISQCFYDYADHFQRYAYSLEQEYRQEQELRQQQEHRQEQAAPRMAASQSAEAEPRMDVPQAVVTSQLQAQAASNNRRAQLLEHMLAARRERDEYNRKMDEARREMEEYQRKMEDKQREADDLTMQLLAEAQGGTVINNIFTSEVTNQGTISGNVL